MLEKFLQHCAVAAMQTRVIPAAELTSSIESFLQEGGVVCAPRFEIPEVSTPVDRAGIPVCILEADWAIGETGTFVINQRNPEVRLASCMAETLVVILERSRLVEKLEDVAAYMEEKLSGAEAGFVAFISGASRTADIERELTIGVHGPRYMHALILEDR
ncbi:LUD domain-containing protein [Desulfurispirillum indicum]|uniref:LUD domain-containing protein n=1 Tax=Desulfurispirillum indicum (strain ATCC BAA-1389 / DSM 22839 / S5) TaxID=653733 RepID=E6W5E6_DESIS|nr:LUD domain-containing protein [Desulfurispirillum indicum]ADU64877.1 protein of unknown function DUF162 [Desulfurispirillum indicum S5]UCZ56808.1 LUD domain-containing protein [Desulfurispirillum indicum]